MIRRSCHAGGRGPCRSDLRWHATGVAAGPWWALALAGTTRQGNSQRQSRWQCAAQGGGAGVPLVGEPFLARISPHYGDGSAQLATGTPYRGGEGEAARWRIVAVGCGLDLRLRQSKSLDPGLHPHGRRKSRRLASSARRIASVAGLLIGRRTGLAGWGGRTRTSEFVRRPYRHRRGDDSLFPCIDLGSPFSHPPPPRPLPHHPRHPPPPPPP